MDAYWLLVAYCRMESKKSFWIGSSWAERKKTGNVCSGRNPQKNQQLHAQTAPADRGVKGQSAGCVLDYRGSTYFQSKSLSSAHSQYIITACLSRWGKWGKLPTNRKSHQEGCCQRKLQPATPLPSNTRATTCESKDGSHHPRCGLWPAETLVF